MPLALWPASRLCPTVASTTSRGAKFVVDSCQPPINCCHRNYLSDLPCLLSQTGTKRTKPAETDRKEEGIKMKKFGFATVVASGLAAAVLGLAGPAQADIGHHDWVHDIQQQATVGSVAPTFGNGR